MRKLASIQKIKDIRPIPKADRIEVATVNGWDVVVKKNEYKVGDLAVYCEIDSFLPVRPEFEFLRKSSFKRMSNGDEGFRLKTMKLRGQVSQGLLLPLSIIPSYGVPSLMYMEDHEMIGRDVTELLGITKYEKPVPANLSGKMKGWFPSFISKTDQERVQNLSDTYDELKDKYWFVTEKLDGSSATFYLRDGEFGVCSRNVDLLETEKNTFWKVARELDIEDKMKTHAKGSNFAFQGELIGEGIQGNPYKIKGQTVKFFDVFDIDSHSYLEFYNFRYIIDLFGLETVPILQDEFGKLPQTMTELLKLAEGKSQLNPNIEREGIVLKDRYDGNESFKVISNKFLLGEK